MHLHQKAVVDDILKNPHHYAYLPMAEVADPAPFTIVRRYDRGKVQPRGTPRTDGQTEGQA